MKPPFELTGKRVVARILAKVARNCQGFSLAAWESMSTVTSVTSVSAVARAADKKLLGGLGQKRKKKEAC